MLGVFELCVFGEGVHLHVRVGMGIGSVCNRLALLRDRWFFERDEVVDYSTVSLCGGDFRLVNGEKEYI